MGRGSLAGFALASVSWVALVLVLAIPPAASLLGGFALGAASTVIGSRWNA